MRVLIRGFAGARFTVRGAGFKLLFGPGSGDAEDAA